MEVAMANILIIDDQSCVRQLISEELILEGHQVQTMGDAGSVREHLQRLQPDIVLLDLYLDGPDGFGVCRDIKCLRPEVPVVILTAYDGFADDPRLCMADGYVVKSCDFAELKTTISKILEQQPALREKIAIQPCLCSFETRVIL
jgi:two-component system nitrogen regulation response regulator GlnG